jgi:serine/threonine protein kinase
LKITDFGLSDTFVKNKSVSTIKYFGTLNYLPPEIIEYKSYFPDKVDIWYCGIILYNALYNRMPWEKACYKTDNMYFVNELNFKRRKLYTYSFDLGEMRFTAYQRETIQKIFLNIFCKDPVFRCNIDELVKMYDDLYYSIN